MKRLEDIKPGDHFWYFESYVGSGHPGCAQLWEVTKYAFSQHGADWWDCRNLGHTCGTTNQYTRLGNMTARMDYFMERILIWL